MERLEDALLIHILTYLGCCADFDILSLVSKRLRQVIRNPVVARVALLSALKLDDAVGRRLRTPAMDLASAMMPLCPSHRWLPAIREVCQQAGVAMVTDQALSLLNSICESITSRAVALACEMREGVLCGSLPSAGEPVVLPLMRDCHVVHLKLALQMLIPPPLLASPLQRAACYCVTCSINELCVTDGPIFSGINDGLVFATVHPALAAHTPPGLVCRTNEDSLLLGFVIEQLLVSLARHGWSRRAAGGVVLTAARVRQLLEDQRSLYWLLRGQPFLGRVERWEAAIAESWARAGDRESAGVRRSGTPDGEHNPWTGGLEATSEFECRMAKVMESMDRPARKAVHDVIRHVVSSGLPPPVHFSHFVRVVSCLRRSRRDWSTAALTLEEDLASAEPVDVVVAAKLLGLAGAFAASVTPTVSGHGRSEGKAGEAEGGENVALLCCTASYDVCEEAVCDQARANATYRGGFSALDLAVMHGKQRVAQLLISRGARIHHGDELWTLEVDLEVSHPPNRPLLSAVARRDGDMLVTLLDALELGVDDGVGASSDCKQALEAAILLRDCRSLLLLLHATTAMSPDLGRQLRTKAGWSGSWDVADALLQHMCRLSLSDLPDGPLPEHAQRAVVDVMRGALFMQHYRLVARLWQCSRAEQWCSKERFPDLAPLTELLRLD